MQDFVSKKLERFLPKEFLIEIGNNNNRGRKTNFRSVLESFIEENDLEIWIVLAFNQGNREFLQVFFDKDLSTHAEKLALGWSIRNLAMQTGYQLYTCWDFEFSTCQAIRKHRYKQCQGFRDSVRKEFLEG